MLRQALVELDRTPHGIDGFLDGVLCVIADLMGDDSPAILVVPAGHRAAGVYRVDDTTATFAASEQGRLVGLPGSGHRALGMREEHPRGVAVGPGAGPESDS